MKAEIPSTRASRPARPRSRVWLYGPYAALVLLAIVWSIGWIWARHRLGEELDRWLAAEATAGRTWTCPGRSVGGYPFRIEVVCDSLTLERRDAKAELGRVVVVAQVYNLGHVIAEASGPLRVSAGATEVEAEWTLLQTSVHTDRGKPQRGDLVAEKPVIRLVQGAGSPLTVTAARLDAHLRPNLSEATTVDGALRLDAAVIPGLDGLIGGTEPANLDIVVGVTQARDLPVRAALNEFDRWRAAGGQLDITRADIVKGNRQVELKGSLALDDLHRPEGRLDAATANIGGLLGRYVGGKAGAVAGLLGALLGTPPAQVQQPAGLPNGGPVLTPLPPVRLANGKVSLGPLQIPGLRLDPLY